MTTQSKTSIANCILKGPEVVLPKRNGSIGKIILDIFKEKQEFVSMIETATGKSITYGKLANESIKCALWLKKENIADGDVISICSLTSIPLFVSFFASFYVGGIMSVCSPQEPPENLRYYFSVLRPKIVFSNGEEAEKIMDILKEEKLEYTKVIVFGNLTGFESFDEILEKQPEEEVENFQCSSVNPHNTAIILITSGSTGMPKFTEHSYEALKYLVSSSNLERGFKNVLKFWITPLSGITGVLITFECVFTDSTILILKSQNIKEMCLIIEKYKVQVLFLAVDGVQKLAVSEALTKYNLSSLLFLFIAGAKPRVEALEAIKRAISGCQIKINYGSTENGGTILRDVHFDESGYTGSVTWNTQLKVVDLRTGDSLKPHKSGELCVKKPFIMKGYYNNPSATKEVIDSEGWIHTGDLGYYDEEGNVYLLDRINMMIRYRNHLLSPSEMENTLAKHPAVENVVVIGVPHPTDGENAIAFVIKAKDLKVSENDLIRFSSCLGEHKIIGGVVFVEDIPYTLSGKVNRPELLKAFIMNRVVN